VVSCRLNISGRVFNRAVSGDWEVGWVSVSDFQSQRLLNLAKERIELSLRSNSTIFEYAKESFLRMPLVVSRDARTEVLARSTIRVSGL